jgi:hypothetical protein
MKETQLIKQILDYCRYRGLLFFRTQSGAIKTERGGLFKAGERGCADITGCLNGKFIAVEAKMGKNTQSPFQKEFERRVIVASGEYWLVYSLDDFIKKLENELKKYNNHV